MHSIPPSPRTNPRTPRSTDLRAPDPGAGEPRTDPRVESRLPGPANGSRSSTLPSPPAVAPAGHRRPARAALPGAAGACPGAGDGPPPVPATAPPACADDRHERRQRRWEKVIHRHGETLAQVAVGTLRRCGFPARPGDVEDLVQEVWCRMLEYWGPDLAFAGSDERLRRYLTRTTRNAAVDEARRRLSRRQVQAGPRRRSRWFAGTPLDVPDHRETPEQRLLRLDSRRCLRHWCAPYAGPRHPRRDLDILEMTFIDGMTSQEAAANLQSGLSAPGVDAVVCRVRRRLAADGHRLPRRC